MVQYNAQWGGGLWSGGLSHSVNWRTDTNLLVSLRWLQHGSQKTGNQSAQGCLSKGPPGWLSAGFKANPKFTCQNHMLDFFSFWKQKQTKTLMSLFILYEIVNCKTKVIHWKNCLSQECSFPNEKAVWIVWFLARWVECLSSMYQASSSNTSTVVG